MKYNYANERLQPACSDLETTCWYRYFEPFMARWADTVRLDRPETIKAAYDAAYLDGVLGTAKTAREYYFGHRLTTYGVTYVSDACCEGCHFCAAGRWNRNFQPRTLSTKEVVADVLCTLLQGHRRVCVLQANWREEAFLKKAAEWLPAVISTSAPLGLEELILNVQTLSEAGYRQLLAIRDATDPEFTLQIRIFQETYDREAYAQLIPPARGNKHDFAVRRNTQMTAWRAGVDAVGCGVLFGLTATPLTELAALVEHARELEYRTNLVRICLPSAHTVEGLQTRIPFNLPVDNPAYGCFSELVYALARLALPRMNWVMSERDPLPVRDCLAAYATETTVGVRSGVGDNLAAYQAAAQGLHFMQATTYSDDPAWYVCHMADAGYEVDLDMTPERIGAIREVLTGFGF